MNRKYPKTIKPPSHQDTRKRLRKRNDYIIRPFFVVLGALVSWWRHPLPSNPRSAIRNPQSGFTLIELLVSVGLTAIFLTMVAGVFTQASGAFSTARSGVEIHQNARAAFNLMLRDFAAAQICSYENKQGFFALSWEPDPEYQTATGTDTAVQAVTFTTLAEQPGTKALVEGISPQVALVRYSLRFNGGSATISDNNGADLQVSTFNLIKQVRFPQLAYPFCDMSAFTHPTDLTATTYKTEILPDETVTTDVVAFNVYDMTIRVYYKGEWIEVADHGLSTGGALDNIADDTRAWASGPAFSGSDIVRILAGDAAPQFRTYFSLTGTTQINVTANFIPDVDADCTYRIDEGTGTFATPTWQQLPDRGTGAGSYTEGKMYPMRVIENIGGALTDFRMPYLVEITLKMADPDSRAKKNFIFTQRFSIPTAFEE